VGLGSFRFIKNYLDQVFMGISFKTFYKQPKCTFIFICWLAFNIFVAPIYISIFFSCLAYWLILTVLFLLGFKNEVTPRKFEFFENPYVLFVFCEVFLRGYLTSFYIIYVTLFNIINKNKQPKFKIFTIWLFNLIFRFIFGLPFRIFKNSVK
jgi:hypothetical protein